MNFSRSKINRLVSVLRYHRPSQLFHRLLSRLERLRLSKFGGGRFAQPYRGEVEFHPLDADMVKACS